MGQLGFSGAETALGKTTPPDLRRIIAAQFVNSDKNPVLAGGEVTGRADRIYSYAAGVGILKTADGAVFLTWPAGVTAQVTQPTTARVDVIYVDNQGAVRVATEGAVNEAQVIVIDKMAAPAGMTATNQATRRVNRNYALPYGATLGWLSMFTETHSQGEAVNKNRIVWTTQRFQVPTDRLLQLRMHQTIYGSHTASAPSTDFAQYGVGSMKYWLYVDNVLMREFELGYSRIWEVRMHNVDFEVNAGEHTVRLERQHVWGTANPIYFGSANNIWQPSSVGIHDEGVSE